jgi:hypothetical protein
MVKFRIFLVLLFSSSLYISWGSLWAFDFGAHLRPFMSFPLEDDSDLYSFGGGGDLSLNADISSILRNPLLLGYSLGCEFSYNVVPLKNAGLNMNLAGGGLEAGLFYYPFSRLHIRADGTWGLYQGFFNGVSYSNYWWKISGEMGFRFSPSFILSLQGGFRRYNYTGDASLYSGFFAGLSAQLIFETGDRNDGILVELLQEEPVFPIFRSLYRQNQIGVLRVSNNESAEVRNLSVSFRAGDYTSSQFLCGTIPSLGKRGTTELPLYGDFSSVLFDFAENGRISGDLIIRYEILGTERTITGNVVVSVFNRNSFRWMDPAALAVFVSPTAPETLDYSKYIVGMARNRMRTGLNQNMQYAMYLYEGLRAGGVSLSQDAQTPYSEFRRETSRVDTIQFPFQTLAYRSGDLDELGLLCAAAFEAAGIKTALIPLENDFLIAFSLNISEEAGENLFYNMENLLIINDEVWIPLSLSYFQEGFINSWYGAVNILNAAFAGDENVDFIVLKDAWVSYPPAALSVQEVHFDKPQEVLVSRMAETDLLRYISAEFGPKIQALQDTIRREGASADRYNRLGLLYMRAGMLAEARSEYQRAAAMGFVSAMVNLGNIAMLERDYSTAEQWFNRVLQQDPSNQAALRNLRQIVSDRED